MPPKATPTPKKIENDSESDDGENNNSKEITNAEVDGDSSPIADVVVAEKVTESAEKKEKEKKEKEKEKEKKKTPKKKVGKLCKIPRTVFLKEAKEMKINFIDNTLIDDGSVDAGSTGVKQGKNFIVADPREFATRSFGWGTSTVRKIKVGDKEVNVRINANIVVVGSKDTYLTRHTVDSGNETAISRKRKLDDAIDKDAARLDANKIKTPLKKKQKKAATPASSSAKTTKLESKIEGIKLSEPGDSIITSDQIGSLPEVTPEEPTNMEVDDLEPSDDENVVSENTLKQPSEIEMSHEPTAEPTTPTNLTPLDTLSQTSIANADKPAGIFANCVIL